MAKDLEDMPESVKKLSKEIDRLKEEVENNPNKSPSLKEEQDRSDDAPRDADEIKQEIEDVQERVEHIDEQTQGAPDQQPVEEDSEPETEVEKFRDRLRKAKQAAEEDNIEEARKMYNSLSSRFRSLKSRGKLKPLDEKMMKKVHRKVSRAKDDTEPDLDV